jgi:hypothetical protein
LAQGNLARFVHYWWWRYRFRCQRYLRISSFLVSAVSFARL